MAGPEPIVIHANQLEAPMNEDRPKHPRKTLPQANTRPVILQGSSPMRLPTRTTLKHILPTQDDHIPSGRGSLTDMNRKTAARWPGF